MVPQSPKCTANFPVDSEGRVHHLGLRRGELANRIVTVGDPRRAIIMARELDGCSGLIDASDPARFMNFTVPGVITIITSKRLFTTVTGRYLGLPVSIVAIGMGIPMMDFFVREARAIVSGDLHIVRFGSCGAIAGNLAGDIIVADASALCQRNPDHFIDKMVEPYTVYKSWQADKELVGAVVHAFREEMLEDRVTVGKDITSDSFYASQGRQDANFDDDNDNLIPTIKEIHPDATSLQMETFQLYHLAACAKPEHGRIRCAAFAMVFANRAANSWIEPETVSLLEPKCARAALKSITHLAIPTDLLHPESEDSTIWNPKYQP